MTNCNLTDKGGVCLFWLTLTDKKLHLPESRQYHPGPLPFLKNKGGNLHDLSCSYNRSSLPYTVNLQTEVSKVEGRKGASTGSLPRLYDCL